MPKVKNRNNKQSKNMRSIKLHFPNPDHLSTLLNDRSFLIEIDYLKPSCIDNNYILLLDPVIEHSPLDSEVVVLSKFARAIKRILFQDSANSIEFLFPFMEQQKGGLVHNGIRIIDSTEIERFGINTTINN